MAGSLAWSNSPASLILQLPSWISILCGLMPRCTIFWSKSARQPRQNCCKKPQILSSGMSFMSARRRQREPPLQYSMTMQDVVSVRVCAAEYWTTFWWLSCWLMFWSARVSACACWGFWRLTILAASCWLGIWRLQARKTEALAVSPTFSSSEIRQGVPSSRRTRTRLVFFINYIQPNATTYSQLPSLYAQNAFPLRPLGSDYNNISSTSMQRMNKAALPQGQQLRKIYCAYHQNEFLTNFCLDGECLMPLCPSCIVEHTEHHFSCGSRPVYVSLQQLLGETRQKCYQQVLFFEDLARENDRIYDYLVSLKQSIHNQLQEDKLKVIQQIDAAFQQFEERVYQQALESYRELQVYNRKQTIDITDFIKGEIQTLQDLIAMLKGENCLAGLITFYATDKQIFEENIRELTQYVAKHKQVGKVSINVKPEKLPKLFEHFCEENIDLTYLSEKKVEEKVQQESKIKESKMDKGLKSILNQFGKKSLNEPSQKQNNFDQSNRSHRAFFRRSDELYKIDSTEGRYIHIHEEKFPFPSSYLKQSQGSLHLL